MTSRRARVPRQTTYRDPRTLDRNLLCAWCGERIEDPSEAVLEAHSAWGDVPLHVHDECSTEQDDARRD